MSIIKLQQKFEGLTDQVLQFNSNGVLQAVDAHLGGIQAQIVVTTTTGATVTCSCEGITLTAIENNGTWEFNLPNLGVWTVNGSLNAYTDSVQVTVSELRQYNTSLNLSTPISNILDENDWATIQAVAQAGTGSSYWSVGDKKALDSTSIPARYVFIIGFDHNKDVESNSLSTITFQLGKIFNDTAQDYIDFAETDEYYGQKDNFPSGVIPYQMSYARGRPDLNGWENCEMRQILAWLEYRYPYRDINSYILTVDKYTANTPLTSAENTSTAIATSTSDKFFLLSPMELFGEYAYNNGYTFEQEAQYQQQYSYYLNNSTKKYRNSAALVSVIYWTRSNCVLGTYEGFIGYGYWAVGTGGNLTTPRRLATYSYGIAPAFVIG